MWLYSPTNNRFRAAIPVGTHILGNSGYTLHPWLLTPFLEQDAGGRLNQDHRRYNNLHSSTRMTVECSFGKSEKIVAKVCRIIAATATLHNILEDMRDDTDIELSYETSGYEDNEAISESDATRSIAQAKRDSIMSIFSN